MVRTQPENALSGMVKNMKESATIQMAQLSRDLAAEGHQVISLTLGEPDFDTPQHIKDAAKKALDDGYTKYTPVPGLVELRKGISRKLERDNDLHFPPDQIVVSNGAKQSIANICMALLDEGDEVVILAPYWVSYWEIVRMTGAKPVSVYAGIEQDFKPTPGQIEEAITDRTKLMIFSTPCNPTGSVFFRDELKAISQMLARHPQVHILSDEIYEYINFTEEGHTSIGVFDEVKDRTFIVNGFAKGYAMTGWRLGYMAAPKWMAEACSKIQGQFTSGANAFGQKAAADIILADLGPTIAMREAFRQRRELIIELFSDIPGMKLNNPHGAFYFFPDISAYFGKSFDGQTIRNSDDFSMYLLREAHVGTVAGSAFGAEECFRLSYAASEKELREASVRIKNALRKLA